MEKCEFEDTKYHSLLSRNALAYNIAYHLRNMEENDNPYLIIERVLTNFEDEKKR